jgi:hypothetical protein
MHLIRSAFEAWRRKTGNLSPMSPRSVQRMKECNSFQSRPEIFARSSTNEQHNAAFLARHPLRVTYRGAFVYLVVAFFTVSALIAAVFAYGYFGPGGVAEQQSILGSMQGIEMEYRAKILATPFSLDIVSGGNKLRLVAIGTFDRRFPYAWIEVSRQQKIDDSIFSFFMVGRNPKLDVSCSQVSAFLSKEFTVPAVSSYLKQQCHRG